MNYRYTALMVAIVLGACAATAPTPDVKGEAAAGSADVTCNFPGNCVDTVGTGGLAPLRYVGTPAQATALLTATLKTFPEATVVRSDPLAVTAIFTTPVGFRDQVDFRIDPQAQRIDFRSRSLFGLFDWGKNRSRMQEFTSRFERQA